MFDIAPSEMLIVALVAIVLIGPKDLPRVMRVVGQWVGRGRTMARHFRSAMDDMMRESELQEMEAKWKAENERIMREHADLISGTQAPYAGHQDAAPAATTPATGEGATPAMGPLPGAPLPGAPATGELPPPPPPADPSPSAAPIPAPAEAPSPSVRQH